ncbi:MAG: hypothetical protein WCO69_04490 [Candidatus Omnitrophota bacterium]
MSTMYEALKKAEAERKGTVGSPAKPSGSDEQMKNMVVILALVFVAVVGWNIYRYQSAASAKKAASAKAAETRRAEEAMARAQAVTTPAAAPAVASNVKHPEGTYGVDGIIAAGAASMAVINGKVLSVGGKIGPLTVQAISAKSVDVLDSRDNAVHAMKVE